MLTPKQIIESEYLEARCSLLEIAAMLDRYYIAIARDGKVVEKPQKIDCLQEALALLAKEDNSTARTEQLLHLFATV
jgi:hypothetical protein